MRCSLECDVSSQENFCLSFFVYLLLVVFVLILPYTFIAVLALTYGRRLKTHKDYNYKPAVTVYVPTMNEENNIRTKLDNLLSQTYPINEILIYDCSTDKTPQIIEEYKEKYPMINLIRQKERIGLARTLSLALKEAKSEIVVKSDCDSVTKSNTALAELVANFADPRVGGATGVLVNPMELESNFRRVMTLIQVAESNLDSTVIGHGPSLVGFRKTASSDVDPKSMGEDTEEFIRIRKNGYRTLVDPSVISMEEVPSNLRVRGTQKSRRAEGIIGAILSNKEMIMRPRFGKFGLIVLPLELFIMAISPIVLLILLPTLLYLVFLSSTLLLYSLLVLLLLVVLWKRKLIIAVVDTQLNSFIGAIRALFVDREPLWQKVR
jgi:cellulose synthase/poly-beta-1,6-N-acetylglucosamine synthase-like glycosyltransferase